MVAYKMIEPEPEQPKKKKAVKMYLSELDTTVINLHSLFLDKPIVLTLAVNLTKQNKNVVRTFQILDCFSAGSADDFKRPDYLG